MKKNDKELMAIAKTLGYTEPALPRESLDEAVNFLQKQTSGLEQVTAEKINYAVQGIINTITWQVAKKVLKESDNE